MVNLEVLAGQFGLHRHLDCRAFLDTDSPTIKLVARRKMQENSCHTKSN
jgi:hypothetical protein